MEITLLDEFKRSWLTSLIGLILLSAGTWLLTWNEVLQYKTILHKF